MKNTALIRPAYHYSYSASTTGLEIILPGAAILAIARPGPADRALAQWAPSAAITAWNGKERTSDPATVAEAIRQECAGTGAWYPDDELADPMENLARAIWMAACGIAEDEIHPRQAVVGPAPRPGTLEYAILEMLTPYPESTRFDILAHELTHDGLGWSTNDSWRMAKECDRAEVLTHARGRWEVYKANYESRARVSDLSASGECDEYGLSIDAGNAFLTIRPTED